LVWDLFYYKNNRRKESWAEGDEVNYSSIETFSVIATKGTLKQQDLHERRDECDETNNCIGSIASIQREATVLERHPLFRTLLN
jgi:hypothetical protein